MINSSTHLLPAWRQAVADTPFANRTLPRDVKTRWNSSYDMLAAFWEMRDIIKPFLDRSSHGLTRYILEDDEWEAVRDLTEALKVCDLVSINASY